MRYYIITSFLLLATTRCVAQVEINNSILMTGPDSLRTISNLGSPGDSADLISAQQVLKNDLIFGHATGTNNLILNLTPPINSYKAGMGILLKAVNSNTDTVTISINGLDSKEIKHISGHQLATGDISAGQIHIIQYNGQYFEYTGRKSLNCPNGFIDANENYCIEINERSPQTQLNAMLACQAINSKLCTWAEWYYACQKTSLSLVNMTNNFELIDDTANHSNTVVGLGNGSGTAQDANLGPLAVYPFRCCYLKK